MRQTSHFNFVCSIRLGQQKGQQENDRADVQTESGQPERPVPQVCRVWDQRHAAAVPAVAEEPLETPTTRAAGARARDHGAQHRHEPFAKSQHRARQPGFRRVRTHAQAHQRPTHSSDHRNLQEARD